MVGNHWYDWNTPLTVTVDSSAIGSNSPLHVRPGHPKAPSGAELSCCRGDGVGCQRAVPALPGELGDATGVS